MGGGGLSGGSGGLGSGGTFTGSSSSGSGGTFTGINGAQSIGVIGTNSRTANSGSLWTPFAANPYAAGLAAGTSSRAAATFGQPLYTITTTTVSSPGGTAALSRGSALGGGFGGYGTGSSSSNTSVRRTPQYGATISFRFPRATASGIQSEAASILARSSALEASRGIQVVMEGNVLVLRGKVADAHDRKLAESLVRMTPGVHDVRNDLTIAGAPPIGTGIE
jgi:hypothetical protein